MPANLGLGALRKLLRLLDRDPCDAVRVKALFATKVLELQLQHQSFQ